MFGFLNKKSPLQKWKEQKVVEEAYVWSRSDRKAADSNAEAEAL